MHKLDIFITTTGFGYLNRLILIYVCVFLISPQGHCCNPTNMSDSTTSSINSRSDQMSVDGQPHHHANDPVNQQLATDSLLAASTSPTPESIASAATSSGSTPRRSGASPHQQRPTTIADKKSATSSLSMRKATVSASRKQNKNEANVALKKHELHTRRTTTPAGAVSGEKSCVGSSRVASCAPNKLKAATGDDDNSNMVVVVENRRSNTTQSTAAGVGVATGTGSAASSPTGGSVVASACVATRKCTAATPNKWDAVMNKIAVNKSAVKTRDYSAVKSKVTCGLSKRGTPAQLRSPSATDHPMAISPQEQHRHALMANPTGLIGKRLFPGPAKR